MARVEMIPKQSPEKILKAQIRKIEKETFERGLVEHMPVADKTDRCPPADMNSDKLKRFRQRRRKKGKLRIVLIDDENQFRQMVRQFLERCGHEVLEAANGEEGVELFFKMPADIVISDVIMPQKEGIEAVLEIKRQFPDAKIIVVSGGGWYGTEVDFDMAKKLGALTLKKPFELQELAAAIEALIE